MRRWARALPVVLIGMLAAIATTTATESAPAGAGAAGIARASAARMSVGRMSVGRMSVGRMAGARMAGARRAVAADAAGSDLTITPVGSTDGRLEVAVDPGRSVQRSFVVANRSAGLRLTVRLAGVDATASTSNTVQFSHAASSDGPGSWISLSDVVSTIEPGAQVRVSVNVAPPANADPGNVMAGVVATVDQAARNSDNAAVTEQATATLPIAIDVKGAATALVSVAQVRAMRHTGSDYLEVTFQNSGATSNVMSGTVRVGGPHPVTSPVRVTAAPLTHTSKRVPFVMPSGAKTVPVSVSTDDGHGDEATWNGKVGFAVLPTPGSTPTGAHDGSASSSGSARSSIPLPAIVVVALVFGAAVIWLGAELRRSRKSRRARKPAPGLERAVTAPGPTVGGPASVQVSVPVAGDDLGQLGAVAAQLAALVESIDRLAGKIGAGTVPVVTTAPVAASPVVPAPVAARAPARTPESVVPSDGPDLSPLFYAPAASSVPGPEVDPFDWPSPAQLDEFVARRNAQQTDPQ